MVKDTKIDHKELEKQYKEVKKMLKKLQKSDSWKLLDPKVQKMLEV